MADELDVLLSKVSDPDLRTDFQAEIDKLRKRRTFGLVFENHLPERVRLPQHPVRRGVRVVRRDEPDEDALHVAKVSNGAATVVGPDGTTETIPVADLVVVAEFGEPIFPGLERLGSIDRGGDKPAHVVINAENHHALEMLRFTHAGKVDCIYIDPPYNTGARDWKYDNHYVDADDAYRHSKWLAFMQRRLLLAKELLNPEDSVLIVTIDEKEVHHLGLLLEQVFGVCARQMVTTVISPAGQSRGREFARVEEYMFVVYVGVAAVVPSGDSMLGEEPGRSSSTASVNWENLLRRGTDARRRDRPNQFYPIFIDPNSGEIISIGDPLTDPDDDRASVEVPPGAVVVWPIRSDGSEGRWRVSQAGLKELRRDGFVRVGRRGRSGNWTINYLLRSDIRRIANGEIAVTGRSPEGVAIVERVGEAQQGLPKSIWNRDSHNAGNHGSAMLRTLLPGRRFPFPKSLYAVEDAIRFFVSEKPEAAVLDFFAGSGTTAHAVARLNRQDGGRRQSIMVTNNEVSVEEAQSLTEQGFHDGDPEWEALGIFEDITRPRVAAAITGVTPEGEPVRGNYRFVDEFPMAEGFEENVEFLRLTYQDPLAVELDAAFEAVAPLLWLRAGGTGEVITSRVDEAGVPLKYAATDRYGLLFDPDEWRPFVDQLAETVRTVFVVTDSASTFSGVVASLPSDVEAVRLYENYLQTFAINQGL